MYGIMRELLFRLPPETAHNLTLSGLDMAGKLGLLQALVSKPEPLPTKVMGLSFPIPSGWLRGSTRTLIIWMPWAHWDLGLSR